jgi:hypothetical protein
LIKKWVMFVLLSKSLVQMQKHPRVNIKLQTTFSLMEKWISLEKHNGLRMVTRVLTLSHQALLV